MSDAPFVTVGVPVWRGERFLVESLRSIQNQTHRNITVLVSIDGPEPESERLCGPFLQDSRFRLVVQPERLGWVGNTNFLMAKVETPYWVWHPQDDVLDARYVEVLLEHAQQNAGAAAVYCDIACFGLRDGTLVQSSVTGDAVARQLSLLREHLAAIAFRGLTRLEALRHCGGLRVNAADSFGLDTVWMAELARWGELLRVPGTLYHKRYHAHSEHARWSTWPFEQRRQAWIAHCADMLAQAIPVPASSTERHELWLAALERLTAPQWQPWFHEGVEWTASDARTLLEEFVSYIRGVREADVPAWLGDRWAEIQASAMDYLLFNPTLADLRHSLAERDKELSALRAVAARREQELADIANSRAWKLASLVRRIRLMLLPPRGFPAKALRRVSGFVGRLLR